MTAETALILAGGCVAAAALLQRMPGAPAIRRRRARPGPADNTPAVLRSDRRMLQLAMASAGETHHRLAPAVRELAAGATGRRRGPVARAAPQDLEAMVSPTTWDLIRPDRRPPDDPRRRGISVDELETVLDDLERLAGGR
ncbi:MAG TPA: hypothetical protein VFQ71_10045 [Gaiellales bacterium]|nr:hypothetical protein [Gaiellales bacterium]